MVRSDHTWRSHPFSVGETYVAATSFASFPQGEFNAGEKYKLVQVSYSHYDNCTFFAFHRAGESGLYNWLWSDDESDALCCERFMGSDQTTQLTPNGAP